jgi:hypothetical protein
MINYADNKKGLISNALAQVGDHKCSKPKFE